MCTTSTPYALPGGKRDALRAFLAEHEIGSEVYYPVPIHKQSFYMSEYGYNVSLPETEKAALEVLSIPVHPGITAADREKVAAAINEFMSKG